MKVARLGPSVSSAVTNAGLIGGVLNDIGNDEELSELVAWLRAFERVNGRPLRVLHVGNIAGNGFINSKMLRQVGVAADIVSHDYTHVMALPEWEEVDLQHSHGDDFDPVFDPRDVNGYTRPDWFIGGPLALCLKRIEERFADPDAAVARDRKSLAAEAIYDLSRRHVGPRAGNIAVMALLRPWDLARKAVARGLRRASLPGAADRVVRMGTSSRLPQGSLANAAPSFEELVEVFGSHFAQRPDQLSVNDLVPYTSVINDFARMFAPYDVVQCYATAPIYALLAGNRPFVAFEHGTLRHFTTDDNPLHRLTSLAYRQSDHTFITNGDCLAYAQRLGIEDYSAVIHPIDVAQHRQDYSDDVRRIRGEIGADVLIYCPVRHDYEIKGTDRAIKALPLIKERLGGRVKMIMSAWGTQVEESRRMLRELGCENDVVWRDSMCRIGMIKHIQAADVVYDQFVLPVFGSTAPQTIAAGKPILASYDPAQTKWLIPEPAPIVSAFTPQEIADRTIECLDPEWRAKYAVRAREWIDRYHSPQCVVREHLKVYRRVLEKYHERDGGQQPQGQNAEPLMDR